MPLFEKPPTLTVLFVCEHGNVKSLIASEWFNRLARERGLSVRAASRGLSPEPEVPPAIAGRLGRDGFDLSRFEPRALAPADLEGASRVVIIGVEPPAWLRDTALPVDRWEGIPPASESYDASRDAIRSRITALLDRLARRGTKR